MCTLFFFLPVCFLLCSARKSLSPVLDSNGSLVVKRRSAEELEKELRGGDAMREHGLHLSEGQGLSGAVRSSAFTLEFILRLIGQINRRFSVACLNKKTKYFFVGSFVSDICLRFHFT